MIIFDSNFYFQVNVPPTLHHNGASSNFSEIKYVPEYMDDENEEDGDGGGIKLISLSGHNQSGYGSGAVTKYSDLVGNVIDGGDTGSRIVWTNYDGDTQIGTGHTLRPRPTFTYQSAAKEILLIDLSLLRPQDVGCREQAGVQGRQAGAARAEEESHHRSRTTGATAALESLRSPCVLRACRG